LQIASSNQATPVNTDGIIIPKIDAFPTTNPTALQQGMMVYLTTAVGVNNPGFYYWDNIFVTWKPLGNAWNLKGNLTVNSPSNPINYGVSTIFPSENFIGTTGNDDVAFGTNTIERMRIKNSGNVGIGTWNPVQPLHVFKNSNASKSSIFGESKQTSLGVDYKNTGVQGLGKGGNSGWGYGVGVLGIGDQANSYYATGVYAHLGTVEPTTPPSSDQALYANGNGIGNAAIFAGGNVGIGTIPTNLLHLNSTTAGAIRIEDGTQSNGRVLTSDATGVATWKQASIDNVVGVLSASGVNVPFNTFNYLQTGSYILLPPGRFAVNVNMLLKSNAGSYAPNNSSYWLRSTFSDSSGVNPVASSDIVGSPLASGNLIGATLYGTMIGTIIINNTSGANKFYYYIVGEAETNNTTQTMSGVGSSFWREDNIIAFRLN
jgi:hypothetical protein